MRLDQLLIYPEAPRDTKPLEAGISADTPLPRALEAMVSEQSGSVVLNDSSEHRPLTSWQALQGLARMLPYDEEYSEIEISCPVHLYSASALTLAAEDADAPVISLLAYPAEAGNLSVYMRINRADPSQAVRSIERHGFTVTRSSGIENIEEEISRERLEELQHYLNI